LITAAHLVAQKRKASEVDTDDISTVYDLFIDLKRSQKFLKEHEKEFMFSEMDDDNNYSNVKDKSKMQID
jgi:RuvB-like protein 2